VWVCCLLDPSTLFLLLHQSVKTKFGEYGFGPVLAPAGWCYVRSANFRFTEFLEVRLTPLRRGCGNAWETVWCRVGL
jgi:hypothetical protein